MNISEVKSELGEGLFWCAQQGILYWLDINNSMLFSFKEDNVHSHNLIENQLRYILSSYKTPVMINSVLSFDMTEQKLIEEPKELLFETQSKQYNGDEISISIEISKKGIYSTPWSISSFI